MVSYETIYQHLCDHYDGDDVYHFFNKHADDVCKRRIVPLVKFMVREIELARYGRIQVGRDMAYATANGYAHSIATVVFPMTFLTAHSKTTGWWADQMFDMAMQAAKEGKSDDQIIDLLLKEIAMPTPPEPEPEEIEEP